jgi:ribonuclease P protein component
VLRSPAIARGRFLEGYARANHLCFARIGIIVGRKSAPRAVDRNLCKRWVREQFRETHRQMAGLDVVVRFRARIHPQSRSELRPEITKVLTAIARCRDSLSA